MWSALCHVVCVVLCHVVHVVLCVRSMSLLKGSGFNPSVSASRLTASSGKMTSDPCVFLIEMDLKSPLMLFISVCSLVSD